MGLYGTLTSMPLTDLLQWLGTARKTGTLVVERRKVVKRIALREGRIAACWSDEPSDLLGHYLVSRGKITEQTLRDALAVQENTGAHLGAILVELGAIGRDDLSRRLREKAEASIFGLFEWDDAEFRFEEGEVDDHPFAVDLRVEDVLLHGLKRWDELQRIRTVFDDPLIVLHRTERAPPERLMNNRGARRIYESIDGERTVAQILLHAHASEFVVTNFLFELHRAGLVRIDRAVAAAPAARVLSAQAGASGEAVREPPPSPTRTAPQPSTLETARDALDRGDNETALDRLDALYAANPSDEPLRKLLAEAEAAFVEKAYRHYLPAERTIVLARPVDEMTSEALTPAEFFLLSRIDGTWNVKSIIQIAPIREVDALRALKRMRERGLIDLISPD